MQPAGAPTRALVVDDDRMSQMVLVRNLRQAGYEVDASCDGLDALAQLRAKSFDLVILDYLMPGMDGDEVLGEITADGALEQVPVVVVSGVGVVANAATSVEATDDGGSVTVRVQNADHGIQVDVQDTGVGIAPEHLAHVFDKFYRVDVGAKGARSATGLGLTFCKNVVEAHGATSTPGAGTCVTFTLP